MRGQGLEMRGKRRCILYPNSAPWYHPPFHIRLSGFLRQPWRCLRQSRHRSAEPGGGLEGFGRQRPACNLVLTLSTREQLRADLPIRLRVRAGR